MHPLTDDVDWDAEGDAALALLGDLVRFDTTNPPGAETACAEFVAEHLRASGLEPTLLESAPGRGNVVARLPATEDRDLPPLLLGCHLDVVAAEHDDWTHPPFAGRVADGYLWGRGTVDMKNMAAASLVCLRLLADAGRPRRRDVIFAGVADEEAGCELGSAWLVDQHPELVTAGYVLGEVGGFTLHVGGRPVYPVQVAEKGLCWVRATARGPSGHGSIPRDDNAVVVLSRFLDRVGRTPLRLRRSAPVERFVTDLASTQGLAGQAVLTALLDPRLSRLAARLLPDAGARRSLQAVLRNTASPTVMTAGSKVNVMPGRAEAELDGRIALGSTAEELVAELRGLAPEAVELEVTRHRTPHAASPDTELFTLLEQVVAEHHPGAATVPSVIPGFTDAHYWAKLGATCYGFAPVRLEPEDPAFAELFHAVDERIPVAGFHAGVRMLADALARFCLA